MKKDLYIKRNLEVTILKYLDSPEIIAITGPRQSGKTTMARKIIDGLDNSVSVSFDDQAVLALFERNPDDFITAYIKGRSYLFIDEFQYAKQGGKILKYIFDKERTKIFISGSSALDLTVQAMKYLVGRILVFHLYPFDFHEFLLAKDKNILKLYENYKKKAVFSKIASLTVSEPAHQRISRYYEEYLLFGGYPRVVTEEDFEAKKDLLKNIYNTYFLREVRDVLGLVDDYKLNVLIKGLALQIGNLIEYNELSRLSGFSYVSLKKYLNFLEKTYVCRFVRPFYKNRGSEIVKNPKAYFFDTGLRGAVVNDFRKIGERPDGSAILENGLAERFIKDEKEFYFWRDKKKREVDFVVNRGDENVIAVELKKFAKGRERLEAKAFIDAYPTIPFYVGYMDAEERAKLMDGFYPVYLF